MKGSMKRLCALSGISLFAAAGLSLSPPSVPPSEGSVELCEGGTEEEVKLEIRAAAFHDDALEMEVELTNDRVEPVRAAFGFTVLDPKGKRVLPQRLFAPRSAPAGHSTAERFTVGALPNGYYRVEARALSQAANGEIGSHAELFLRVEHGVPVPIEFDEWWDRSGVAGHGGMIAYSGKEVPR